MFWTLCVFIASGCTLSTLQAEVSQAEPEMKFSKASIILERNVTDDDAEIVIYIKGDDEGLAWLRVTAPNRSRILEVATQDKVIGLRQFAIAHNFVKLFW